MCGICGIVNHSDRQVDRAQLEQMNLAIQHRGPDGDGFYIEAGVGLAMRRLAIIDLKTGQQPMAALDGQVQIVFNGEIYNFEEVRQELEALTPSRVLDGRVPSDLDMAHCCMAGLWLLHDFLGVLARKGRLGRFESICGK